MKFSNLSVLSLFLFGTSAFAQPSTFQVAAKADASPQVYFSVGYTAGTHNGSATNVTGTLQLQKSPFMISNADIDVPLAQMTTGNIKRDCHMSESLGLDYTKSVYPGAQVCDNNDSIPKSGNDSIAFPSLHFSLTSLLDSTANDPLVPGVAKQVSVTGTFQMHGVKKSITVPVTITLVAGTPNLINIKGDFHLLMSDYGVIVRKFLFVTVFDDAHVTLDLNLAEQ